MDRGTRRATVHGVTKSRTRLSDFQFHFGVGLNACVCPETPAPCVQSQRVLSDFSLLFCVALTYPEDTSLFCLPSTTGGVGWDLVLG